MRHLSTTPHDQADVPSFEPSFQSSVKKTNSLTIKLANLEADIPTNGGTFKSPNQSSYKRTNETTKRGTHNHPNFGSDVGADFESDFSPDTESYGTKLPLYSSLPLLERKRQNLQGHVLDLY